MAGRVHLVNEGAVARVTLSKAGKLNAMSRAMWLELAAVFGSLQQSRGTRAIVIAGEGGDFCAGGDISEYPAFRFDERALASFHENEVWPGLRAMLDCDVPIVAQIEGACMGAGLEIASCCDLRIAAGSAKFGAPIAKLGFPMAPREAAIVARALGDSLARQLLLEAAVVDAETLLTRGFLHRVTDDSEVADAASRSALRIASLAPEAARMNKQTLRSLAGAVAAIDTSGAYSYADSAEHREGIAAFLDKRPPRFP